MLKIAIRYIFELDEILLNIQNARMEIKTNKKNVCEEKGNILLNSNIRIVDKQNQFSILYFRFLVRKSRFQFQIDIRRYTPKLIGYKSRLFL
jgi:hypothetical protein